MSVVKPILIRLRSICLMMPCVIVVILCVDVPVTVINPNGPMSSRTVPISNQSAFSPQPWPEVSPAIVGSEAYVSTNYSYRCKWSQTGITAEKIATQRDANVLWRRNYAGVYGAEQVKDHTLTFLHGENKNEIIDGKKVTNTVNGATTCYSGTQPDGTYRDCWDTYFAFISAGDNGKDRGPIIWPRNGYLTSQNKPASHGVRHPTTIKTGGYIYVFYLDTSVGVAVARSPVSALAKPGSFHTWTGLRWRPSLPTPRSLHQRGPNAASLLGKTDTYFFAVTAIAGGYLGLGFEAPTPTSFGTQVWHSRDLLRWTPKGSPMWVANGRDIADAFDHTSVRYPRPLNGHEAVATTGSQVIIASW